MLLYLIIVAGAGSLTEAGSAIRGFFYDPSLFLVNGNATKTRTVKVPSMATPIRWSGCDGYEARPLQTIYCYNTAAPSDWAFWCAETFKSSDGITVELYYNDNGSNDEWCDDSYRAASNYTGTNALNYVLANHNIGYLGIFTGGSSGPPEGAYYIYGSGSYTESYEAVFVDCYSTSPYMNSSNMLGDEILLLCDAGYPGVPFDVGSLTAGSAYVFYAYSYPVGGSCDPYMAIHRGQNDATYNWQARGEWEGWYNNTGAGSGESVVFTPAASGRYAIQIGQWNQGGAPEDTFGVGFYPYFSNMTNETPIDIPDGGLGRFVQPDTVKRWAVVGTKPGGTDDYDVFIKATHDINAIWDPALLGYSNLAGNDLTDFVLINYHNRSGSAITGVDWFARFNKMTCNRVASGEWCRSHGIISDTSSASYGPYSYTAREVAWSWDIIPVQCPPSDTHGLIIYVDITSGSIDLGIAIADPDNGDFQGRSGGSLTIANSSGAGGDEMLIWQPDFMADTYGLAVFSENMNSGTFQITYRCPRPLDTYEAPGDHPQELSLRLKTSPIQDILSFTLGLPGDTRVELAIYDATGRVVVSKDLGHFQPGWHEINEDISTLTKGVFFVRVRTQMGWLQRKVILK
ncbi:MAG: T9SS type A sorting domain-containing protein [candidate division WOR-3 bacterium]